MFLYKYKNINSYKNCYKLSKIKMLRFLHNLNFQRDNSCDLDPTLKNENKSKIKCTIKFKKIVFTYTNLTI